MASGGPKVKAAEPARRPTLSRKGVVARALEIGNAEGLAAVSLRRVAADFGVTPMALYRHVHDKQDLLNAMTEAVLEGLDLSAGLRPSMHWTDRLRRAMMNFREQMEARPLAIPLSIAYSGEGPPSFWRMSEDLLSILLEAGFKRREALVLIRVVSNLLSGYLMLMSQGGTPADGMGPQEIELVRRHMELAMLSLPRDQFPNLREGATDMSEVWMSHPDRWWRDTADLIVFGLEAMLERSIARRRK